MQKIVCESSESRVGLAIATVREFEAVDSSGFYSTFKQNWIDKSLLPRERGRRAARPDEGVVEYGSMRAKPPHPALSPNSFAATLPRNTTCKHANELGERGHVSVIPNTTNPI